MHGAPQGFGLILASASPRRRELLTQAGYIFTIEAADMNETLRAGEDPAAYVRRLAVEKAEAVFARQTGQGATENRLVIVLGADTTVVCDGEILGKPCGPSDAQRMLRRLSGRTHSVLTGLAAVLGSRTKSVVESTEVTFSPIPEDQLAAYCATPEPLDKAGAYGIQGYAARWIPRIDGCYFNVMGLPIARTVELIDSSLAAARQADSPAAVPGEV